MTQKREQVAKIILYITALIGIIPALIIGVQYFNVTQPIIADLSAWLAHPSMPAVFAILFSLGAGLSTYLSRKWFLVLLLPLLYLALLPILIVADQHKNTKEEPFLFYGQTKPGVGFKQYEKGAAWTIQIDFPEHIKKKIKSTGKKPIVITSLGGNLHQWKTYGFNSIYPYTLNKPKSWLNGFSLYFQVRNHHHKLQGHRRETTNLITRSPLKWPVKYKWFISYVVIIPED